MDIGGMVKRKRLEMRETQEEFGKRFGISHAAISDLERGKTKAINSDILKVILSIKKVDCPVCKGKGYIEQEVNIDLYSRVCKRTIKK